MTAELRWSVEREPTEKTINAVRQELIAFNIATASIDDSRNVAVFVHNADSQLVGGATGTIWGRCIEIAFLWVEADLRGSGHGRRLIETLEDEARAQGCVSAVLDTFSFQAPGFYQRLGYEAFGVVDGYPRGIEKVFLKKRLTS